MKEVLEAIPQDEEIDEDSLYYIWINSSPDLKDDSKTALAELDCRKHLHNKVEEMQKSMKMSKNKDFLTPSLLKSQKSDLAPLDFDTLSPPTL